MAITDEQIHMTVKSLASKGLTRRAVARQLSLSNRTVRYHLRQIAAGAPDGPAHVKVAFAKLYTTKAPITAAHMRNDRVLPFYQQHEVPLLRILTDRGSEYCGSVEQHDYQLYLAVNDIDHTHAKARSLQTNGICERFHEMIPNEFYQVSVRQKIYATIEELQAHLDA